MNETTFRIRPYSKRELARLYFPETANIDSAVSNLRLWILRNSEVMEKLHDLYFLFHCSCILFYGIFFCICCVSCFFRMKLCFDSSD